MYETKRKDEKGYYRGYMDSYKWNYTIFELVDYLEEKLFNDKVVEPADTDLWINFKVYCESRQLNWRVIRKMIEYSVNTPFESEMELVKHEAFKPVKRKAKIENSSTADIETILKGFSESL